MTADKLNNSEDVKRFLGGLGLHIDESIVKQVLNVLTKKSKKSLYSLYATRKDMPPPVCGKGTAYKIRKFYNQGELKPYLAYLSTQETINEPKTEQIKEVEPGIPKEKETEHPEVDHAITPQAQKRSTDLDAGCCSASPESFDVTTLIKLGVPPKKAPGILYEWRSSHKKGSHNGCSLYKKFIDDLNESKIPYKQAEAILRLELRSKLFNRDVELARIYRPWESLENFKASIKENESEEMKKHLDEITTLLINFKKEVETVRNNRQWDVTFEVEKNDLFTDMLNHCWDVKWEFDQFKREKFIYDLSMKELISRIKIAALPGVNEIFVESIAYYVVFLSVYHKLPHYRIESHNGADWMLSIGDGNQSMDIATGAREIVDEYQRLHTALINWFKKDPAIKTLLDARGRMLGFLKSLQQKLGDALEKRIYYHHTSCQKCPEPPN